MIEIDLLVEFIKALSPEHYIIISSCLLNFILIIFKLKGSKFEKDYKKALKSSISDDYVCKINGKYYSIEHIHFVKKEDLDGSEVIL